MLYEIKKSYNFIYEFFSKRGSKLRGLIVSFILFIVFFILFNVYKFDIFLDNLFVQILLYGIIGLNLILILFEVGLKYMQYINSTYKFYESHMEYIDSFLNKEKNTLSYINIREMELKRNVFDRIMNYGTISIYTNAEKSDDQGIIMQSIKNPEEVYNKIDKIVHRVKETEEDFLDDIKN